MKARHASLAAMKPKASFEHIDVVSHSADETGRFFSVALGLEPGWLVAEIDTPPDAAA